MTQLSPDRSPAASPSRSGERQSSNSVLLVRPASFGYNPETAENNAFMHAVPALPGLDSRMLARAEFDGLVAALQSAGVDVAVVEDSGLPPKPDAVFPNNWFSTHADGTVVTYPMFAETRRLERENPVLPMLRERFVVERHVPFEGGEATGQFLEGTGSLVLDRESGVAYLARSERSDEVLAKAWAQAMGYELLVFDARDPSGTEVYHTNVVMGIGTHAAVFCAECCTSDDAARVRAGLVAAGKQVVEITWAQVVDFAGNAIELIDGSGARRWVMSTSAYEALRVDQRAVLEREAPIIHAAIPTIEHLGGGSVRCMIATVHLPRREGVA